MIEPVIAYQEIVAEDNLYELPDPPPRGCLHVTVAASVTGGVDRREAGRAVCRLVTNCLPNGRTIAIFIGNNPSANAIARAGGVLDELATPEANGTAGAHPQRPEIGGKFYGKYFLVDGEPKTD